MTGSSNSIIIRNITDAQVLFTRRDGAVIFLSGRGSITYPDFDILTEPLDGLLHVDFTRVDSLEEGQQYLKNASNSLYMCVVGRVGDAAIPATYLLPGGRVSVNHPGAVDLKVFTGKYELSVSKNMLQGLDNPKLAVPLVVFRDGPNVDTFTVFTLSRVLGGGDIFEIRSNSTPLSVAPSCMLSCKTLPHVSLCMATKSSVIILTASFFLTVIVVCLFTGMYIMTKPARCEK